MEEPVALEESPAAEYAPLAAPDTPHALADAPLADAPLADAPLADTPAAPADAPPADAPVDAP